MATFLPSSGAISINDINTLFALGNDLNSYRGTTYYTSTAGPFTFSSGAIAMDGFYGTGPTANRVAISYTFSASTANASLAMSSIPGYTAGSSDITITVNSGVYLYATSTANAGLTLTGGTAGDTITVVNNGNIIGQGGRGSGNPVGAGTGGPAFSIAYNISLNNTGYVAGGGGGGSSGSTSFNYGGGGGGAGGGAGGGVYQGFAAPGAGGAIGSSGGNGANGFNNIGLGGFGGGAGGSGGGGGSGGAGGSGGGGGRILPGTGGAASSGYNGVSGAGGSANNPAPTSGKAQRAGGGGGGWGATGYISVAGGKAINLNGNTITYIASGTIWGLVS